MLDIRKGVIVSRTNLIDSKKEITAPWKGMGLVVFLTLAIWSGAFFYNDSVKKKIALLQNNANQVKQGRDYLKIASVADTEERLSSLNKILLQRVDWEKLMQKIEENTLPEITFSNMDAKVVTQDNQFLSPNSQNDESTKYEIILKGSAIGLTTLAKQITVFEGNKEKINDYFAKEITIQKIDMKKTDSGEIDKGRALDFTLQVIVNPNIITNNIEQ